MYKICLYKYEIDICERNEFFSNQVLSALGWVGSTFAPTCTDLLNPTLERDTSHSCLISIWPKEGSTIVCVMWASLKNCARMHYVLQSSLGEGGVYLLNPKGAFLWEEQIFPQSSIVRFGDHTHYGTPFLRPSAYKARVGGVSFRCGIEQIREGGIGSSAHSQNKQYLIEERFVPPTISKFVNNS